VTNAGNAPAARRRPGRRASAAAWPRPRRPWLPPGLTYRVQGLLVPNRFYHWLARRLEAFPAAYWLFTAGEKTAKSAIFGCRMCGQCALPVTGYACPQTCPKQLRNGPCGGVGMDGSCEVYPDVRCVWVAAYERAERHGRTADLRLLQRPLDHRRWGRSSWVNYWQGRDGELWTANDGLAAAPEISRPVPSVPAASLAAGEP